MEVRDKAQRVRDARYLLANEVDAWVATASPEGEPYLVPLSFAWTGEKLIMATPEDSITVRNLRNSGNTRIAIGGSRDVVMIDGYVELGRPPGNDPVWQFHEQRAGFNALHNPAFVLLTLTPYEIQAWRNPAELPERVVFRDGVWLHTD